MGFLIGAGLTAFIYGVMSASVGHEGSGDNWGFGGLMAVFYLPFLVPTLWIFKLFGKPIYLESGHPVSFWVFCTNALINGSICGIFGWIVGLTRKFGNRNRK
jgi:hypothetical protein